MKHKKELFVTSVRMLSVDGEKTIPTQVYYNSGKPFVGKDAFRYPDESENLKDNFKLELGMKDPASLSSRSNIKNNHSSRTTIGVAKDFCDLVLKKVEKKLEVGGLPFPKKILIAEPLSLSGHDKVTDAWLSNYRASLRRILHGKFDEIDFMPEPFAVFQYYRYGIKHPIIAQNKKHVALVIDFGGGTFDVSVIETTSDGDISQSGRNSRPLSASSIPVGGYYVNQMLANDILFECIGKKADKKAIRKAIDLFISYNNSKDSESFESLNDMYLNFFRSYQSLLRRVEEAKISICSNIANWSLTANLVNASAYQVRVPVNPFSQNPDEVDFRLDAERIRKIFEERIWKQKLLPSIESALERAAYDLEGKSISVGLLSGGSSNIRWIKNLIDRDVKGALSEAGIIELTEDFQEIVAKGLSVECARRHYTDGEGDFRAVTYNRLCLVLNPNKKGIEIKRYKPVSGHLEEDISDGGVLLPSSSSLRGLMDKPLRWRTKLSSPPTMHLEYHFLRSSFDPDDIENLHNVTESKVSTPSGIKFGNSIDIELTVRNDGTATPKFIYGKTGYDENQTIVEGKPFYIDMTNAADEVIGETYLGFDFGTSTSSFSYVTKSDINIYVERSKDKTWLEISDLVYSLPYPIAFPLGSYIAEHTKDNSLKWEQEVIESMLTISFYILLCENYAQIINNNPSFIKGFLNRSAGPLWGGLKSINSMPIDRGAYYERLKELFSNNFMSEMDAVVDDIAQYKHGKKSNRTNVQRTIIVFGNILMKVFSESELGYFEDVRQKQYMFDEYEGVFRSVQGYGKPFTKLYAYHGEKSIPPGMVFIAPEAGGEALCLSPFILSGLQDGGQASSDEIYLFDIHRHERKVFGYRSVQESNEISVSESGNYSSLYKSMEAIRNGNGGFGRIDGINLIKRN